MNNRKVNEKRSSRHFLGCGFIERRGRKRKEEKRRGSGCLWAAGWEKKKIGAEHEFKRKRKTDVFFGKKDRSKRR